MNISVKRATIKVLKISGLFVAGILLLLFLLPVLFPGTVVERVKAWTNDRLNGDVNFSKVRLTFFSHFPSLTVSMYDFTLKGSAPFKNDTLVAAKEIALGVNIRTLIFNKQIRVDKIFIDDADIKILVNAKGEANYNVYKSDLKDTAVSNDTTKTALRIEKISIQNSHFIYDDLSTQILINARELVLIFVMRSPFTVLFFR